MILFGFPMKWLIIRVNNGVRSLILILLNLVKDHTRDCKCM